MPATHRTGRTEEPRAAGAFLSFAGRTRLAARPGLVCKPERMVCGLNHFGRLRRIIEGHGAVAPVSRRPAGDSPSGEPVMTNPRAGGRRRPRGRDGLSGITPAGGADSRRGPWGPSVRGPGDPCSHLPAVRPGPSPPSARPCRWPPARFRYRGRQAAQRGRTLDQPPQEWRGLAGTNLQTRYRLPSRTPPRRHPHPGAKPGNRAMAPAETPVPARVIPAKPLAILAFSRRNPV